jgi:hypothetical protein
VTIYSYDEVLRAPRSFHSFPLSPGGHQMALYKPVPWISLVYFAVVELLVVVLAHTPPGHALIAVLKPLCYYAALPGGVVWLVMHVELDGRSPHRWTYSYLKFLARPRRTLAGSAIARPGRRIVTSGSVRVLWDAHAPRLHHGWLRGGVLTTSVPVRFTFSLRHRSRVVVGDDERVCVAGYAVHDRVQVRP